MYGKSVLIVISVLFICLSVTTLATILQPEKQERIIAVIINCALFIAAFVTLFLTVLKSLFVSVEENVRYSGVLKDREVEIKKLETTLASYSDKDLLLYSRFGGYELFRQELIDFNEKIEALCLLLTPLKDAADSLQFPNLPLSADIDSLLKVTSFITENIRKAFDIADNLSSSAKTAFEVSERVQKGVKQVTGALQDSLQNAVILLDQSQKISGIIALLSEISLKINILSINASIVSARAGAQGKPFEIVAKEIRKLASETEKSLNSIAEEIFGINSVIKNVVEKIKYATEQTDAEKNALISVVGSLQGITLGVEVFRAVSKVAKDKSVNQVEQLNDLSRNCSQFMDIFSKIAAMKNDLDRIILTTDEVNERNSLLKTRYAERQSGGGSP